MQLFVLAVFAALQILTLNAIPVPDEVTGSVDGNNSIGTTIGNKNGSVAFLIGQSPPITLNNALGQPGNASAGNGGANGTDNGTGTGNGNGGGIGNGNGNLNGNGGGIENGNANGNNNGQSSP